MESSSEIKAPKPVYVVVETEYIFFFASSSLKPKKSQKPSNFYFSFSQNPVIMEELA